MNKKGFTLTELIITIGLLAVLGLVIVSNMSGLLEKNKEENYQTFVKSIEEAACTFIELKVAQNYVSTSDCKTPSGCNVAINALVQEGLLSEKEAISPKTGQSVASKTVKITYRDNKKICTFTE